ncbi:hypothetical protein SAMD00019534_035580 [Acytostelium subglobosum LB1]|uniref:hypothetical protein n=1 Tax=Acytostelium subglobosum LB1 TaxID=1410327 RepID=UPI000644B484|nr:hypothetical protein SAMD00019534_035580 [Acytostelium subglobosum LB1]GAM20383.1 hypothetical protein SAMD00019534_035580 [Acytostelium subglobosum LB1]|eukprot:XP_012759904.1 hypothetical protein SAMD00019534_035580 [Acytostelium subglobosum LB1]
MSGALPPRPQSGVPPGGAGAGGGGGGGPPSNAPPAPPTANNVNTPPSTPLPPKPAALKPRVNKPLPQAPISGQSTGTTTPTTSTTSTSTTTANPTPTPTPTSTPTPTPTSTNVPPSTPLPKPPLRRDNAPNTSSGTLPPPYPPSSPPQQVNRMSMMGVGNISSGNLSTSAPVQGGGKPPIVVASSVASPPILPSSPPPSSVSLITATPDKSASISTSTSTSSDSLNFEKVSLTSEGGKDSPSAQTIAQSLVAYNSRLEEDRSETSPDTEREGASDEKRSIFKKFPHQWAIGKLEKDSSQKKEEKERKEIEKKEEKERKEKEKAEKKERKERERKEKDMAKEKEKDHKDRMLGRSASSITAKLKHATLTRNARIEDDSSPSSNSPVMLGHNNNVGGNNSNSNSVLSSPASSFTSISSLSNVVDTGFTPGSSPPSSHSHIGSGLGGASASDSAIRSGATQLDTSRGLMTWGSGSYGKLGFKPEKDSQNTPERLPNFQTSDICSISCGSYYSAMLTENGDVYMWGRGSVKNPPVPTLGNGTLDDQMTPQKVEILSEVVVISIGFYHSAALKSNGELLTWGVGEDGQLGHGDTLNQPVPKVVQAMSSHWVTQVCCGEKHTICLTKNGKVFTWGTSEYGQLGLGDTQKNSTPMMVTSLDKYQIIQIACGATHNAVLTNQREVIIFGNGAAMGSATIISVPTMIPSLKSLNIERLSCGHYSTAALTECGDVYTWGTGQELGHGHTGNESQPKLVEALRSQSVRQISCGGRHMAFLTDSGKIYTAGKDSFGQLGHAAGDQKVPKRIDALLGKFVAISCGENHNTALFDTTRSFRDKFGWKLLETQRTFVRSLNILRSIFLNPLMMRDRDMLPEYLKHLPYVFLSEEEIKTLFGQLERVYNVNSSLLHQMNARMFAWSNRRKIGDILLNHFKSTDVLYNQYIDHIPSAIHMLDGMLKKTSSPIVNYLKECERLAMDRRKAETDDEQKEFNLRALLLEPLLVMSRFQKNINGMVKYTKNTHIDYQGLVDLEMMIEEKLGKVQTIVNLVNSPNMLANYVASQANMSSAESSDSSSFLKEYDAKIESLQNFKKTCLKLIKSSKKYYEVEVDSFKEQGHFTENLLLAKSNLETVVEPSLASSLEHFSASIKKVNYLRSELSTRTNSAFSQPLTSVVDELDAFIPLIVEMRKRVFDSHVEYDSAVSKLYSLAKNVQSNDKKVVEAEKEVGGLKKALDKTAHEFDGLFKAGTLIQARSLKVFYACMKAQQDYFERGLQRFQAMKPSFDALDSHFRQQSRAAWSKSVYDQLIATFAEGKGSRDSVAAPVAPIGVDTGSFEDVTAAVTTVKSQATVVDPHTVFAELESTDWQFILDPPTANEFTDTFIEEQYNQLVSLLASPSLQVVQCVVSPCSQEEQGRIIDSISRIFDSFNKIRPIIQTGIEVEVAATANSSTLFRSNTTATKLMTAFTKMKGMSYLTKVITPLVKEVIANPNGYEVDPSKINEGSEELMTNMMSLIHMSEKFTDNIIDSLHQLPVSLREISKYLQQEVVKKFPDNKHSSVGGFIFLRFLCPAIIAPFTAGLVDEAPGPEASRALVLIGKVLQNLANGIEFGQKESFMLPVNRFIIGNLTRLYEYFDKLTDVPDYRADYVPLSSQDEVQKDIRNTHIVIVKNLPKVIKQLALYKQKDIIGQLAKTLPSNIGLISPCPATIQNVFIQSI